MISFFTNLKNRQIVASQDKLLNRFLHDRNFANKMANHPLHACLGKWLPIDSNATVLELGCGPGKYIALLSTLGLNVTAVDPCQFPTWEKIKKETSAKILDNVFAEKLPFPNESFDHIACMGALLYFADPEKSMLEMYRVIKPGGNIIIRTVNKNNLYTLRTGNKYDPASNNLYTMEELIKLVSNSGFKVTHSFSHGFRSQNWINFWWYLECVWLPVFVQEFLSSTLKPENRVQNIVVATK
jgi:ubiquinone/menaquinone biosynthesis C-methylase UbiE